MSLMTDFLRGDRTKIPPTLALGIEYLTHIHTIKALHNGQAFFQIKIQTAFTGNAKHSPAFFGGLTA